MMMYRVKAAAAAYLLSTGLNLFTFLTSSHGAKQMEHDLYISSGPAAVQEFRQMVGDDIRKFDVPFFDPLYPLENWYRFSRLADVFNEYRANKIKFGGEEKLRGSKTTVLS